MNALSNWKRIKSMPTFISRCMGVVLFLICQLLIQYDIIKSPELSSAFAFVFGIITRHDFQKAMTEAFSQTQSEEGNEQRNIIINVNGNEPINETIE